MRILIVGGSGYLGREVARRALAAGDEVTATYATRPGDVPGAGWLPLDLRDGERITQVLAETRPDVVVNTAYRKGDWAVTAEGPVRLALAAGRHGTRLVHVSSDVVFSGADVTYDESAAPDPVSPYGAAKAAAETAIRLCAPAAVVARTSLILGDGDSPHETLVHDLASGRRAGSLFTDDVRCPVHVTDLADALLELAVSTHTGVCHLAGPDPVSRYDIGLLVSARDALDPCALTPGSRVESGVPGPLDVRLDSTRTRQQLRTVLRGPRDFLSVR
ncbi:SDR family oxidoreductase [Streptomyces sp. NPDC090106]|uniref:SDR family oxidoreductase n=1 Tax=Streptomyces sp. NPDC090106 TaxID=3365946 RepID=UPI00382EA33C